MAKRKPHTTRTYAAIHFEDLDPHRFEDLVRELVYDLRDWQTIEATGLGGSDDGFDIRAYERTSDDGRDEPEEESVTSPRPMEGHQWMIQVKREKTLGPTAIRKILSDVDAENPPYGYILVAPANFSKAGHDAFREELGARGVMEFDLWGKAKLEDLLHLPKNDRLLFSYFGISLTSRRRSRATEVRAGVIIKNRLHKVLGGPADEFSKEILIRDLNDVHYPFEVEYRDFAKNPRWMKRTSFGHHPLGLWLHSHEFYACADRDSKEWDFTPEIDLRALYAANDDDREGLQAAHRRAVAVWKYMPRAKQVRFAVESLIRYEDIALVDAEGDRHFQIPHLFVDFAKSRGPFRGEWSRFVVDGPRGNLRHFNLPDDWRRAAIFPKKFPNKVVRPKLREDVIVSLDAESLKNFLEYKNDADTLYTNDGRYDGLSARDVVRVHYDGDERFLEVTHIERSSLASYMANHSDAWSARQIAQRQLGGDPSDDEEIVIVETQRSYPGDWK